MRPIVLFSCYLSRFGVLQVAFMLGCVHWKAHVLCRCVVPTVGAKLVISRSCRVKEKLLGDAHLCFAARACRAGLIAVLLAVGANLVISTSAIGQ